MSPSTGGDEETAHSMVHSKTYLDMEPGTLMDVIAQIIISPTKSKGSTPQNKITCQTNEIYRSNSVQMYKSSVLEETPSGCVK